MRIGLVVTLSFISSFSFGQSKWELIGEFKHSVFMYSYTLTLRDGENYEILESTDLGSEKTIGTWTIRGQAIRLTPKKKIIVDVHKKQDEKTITDSKEEVVVIETKDLLTFKKGTEDIKLERRK
jgi:hypothetical protein